MEPIFRPKLQSHMAWGLQQNFRRADGSFYCAFAALTRGELLGSWSQNEVVSERSASAALAKANEKGFTRGVAHCVAQMLRKKLRDAGRDASVTTDVGEAKRYKGDNARLDSAAATLKRSTSYIPAPVAAVALRRNKRLGRRGPRSFFPFCRRRVCAR